MFPLLKETGLASLPKIVLLDVSQRVKRTIALSLSRYGKLSTKKSCSICISKDEILRKCKTDSSLTTQK